MSNNKAFTVNRLDTFKNISLRYRQYYTYIEPMLSHPFIRSYFGLVASLLLTSFLFVFALSPTINVVLGLQKQISDQKNTITALDAKLAALVKAQDSYNLAQPYLPLLDQALPKSPTPQTIIEDIHKTASLSGIKLVGFQIQSAPLSKDLPLTDAPIGVPAVQVAISVSGPKETIRKFLGAIENQLRYIRLDTITLSPNDKAIGFSADIVDMAYFFH